MSFIEKYMSPAYTTRLIILSVDIVLSCLSFYLATLLIYNFEPIINPLFSTFFILVFLVRLITFKLLKAYSVMIRFSGAQDVKKVFFATTIGSGILFLLFIFSKISNLGFHVSGSVVVIDYLLLVAFLSSVRLMMPVLYNILYANKKSKTNVVIFGAGELGIITSKIIKEETSTNYKVVGFSDDDYKVHHNSLEGIPIYPPSLLDKIVKRKNIKKIVLAIKDISLKRKREISDFCLENGVILLQPPSTTQWLDGNFEVNELKEIKIEDLLNRSPIQLDKENISNQIFGKCICITGGAGSIGSELIRQVIKFNPKKLILIDQAETPLVNLGLEIVEEYNFNEITPIIASVTDRKRMEAIFMEHRPEIIFHAAAYKHVPIMESYPREAINVNIKGTKLVADLAVKFRVKKFVLVSTDKAVNPTNVMGASKRIAEMYIQSLNQIVKTQFITTRFGNVLGSNGSVVPRFKQQIKERKPVTVTHKGITRYFMTIPEASQLVLEAGTMGNGGEVFLFDMGEPVKILDLAEKLIRLSGLKPYEDIKIVFSGLRPGEKLIEELLTDKEKTLPTHHPKITKAITQKLDYYMVNDLILDLIQSLDKIDDMKLVEKMKEIVPEYISNNSVYQLIDQRKEIATNHQTA